MTKLYSEIGEILVQKILDGDYPKHRRIIKNLVDNLVRSILATVDGAIARATREGVFLEYSSDVRYNPKGVKICLDIRIRAVDPVKLNMVTAVAAAVLRTNDFNVIASTGIYNELLREAFIEALERWAKKHPQDAELVEQLTSMLKSKKTKKDIMTNASDSNEVQEDDNGKGNENI